MSQPLLTVEDLHTQFTSHERTVHAVNGVSFPSPLRIDCAGQPDAGPDA